MTCILDFHSPLKSLSIQAPFCYLLKELMQYMVKKIAIFGRSIYGPYKSYQEALDASEELKKNTLSESFFKVENLPSEVT